jgi:hypothetical protein
VPGFTAKYDCTKLVYYEVTNDVWGAIAREKQIKGWIRRKKVAINPAFDDLSIEWTASRSCRSPQLRAIGSSDRTFVESG